MNKIRFLFSIILLLLILILIINYYSTLLNEDSDKKNSTLNTDSIRMESELTILKQKLEDVKSEEIFWQNRLEMAKSEQFNLVINLPESLLVLEFKGIGLHQCRIVEYHLSHSLDAEKSRESIKAFISQIPQLKNEWATIPKQPIRVRDIKDMIDTTSTLDFTLSARETSDVFVALQFSNDLMIGMSQIEETKSVYHYLKANYRKKKIDSPEWERSIFEEYEFFQLMIGNWITLGIARSDILAIYRALNNESKLVLLL